MPDSITYKPYRVAIMGVRGVPASHGGFETFAARLAPYLVSTGWEVSVYCQEDGRAEDVPDATAVWETSWEGVRRIHIAVGPDTPFNSIRFDLLCVSHAMKDKPDAVLILGYNTAMFSLGLRMAGIATVINMDGIEWSRAKWSAAAKAWLYLNERAGCWFAHHLIADHPQIARHLRTRVRKQKITVIPYGTDSLNACDDAETLRGFALNSMGFATLIARPEPENSVLEMVGAFSAKPRGIKLLVLGKYRADTNAYHAKVLDAASPEVIFAGAIYDTSVVQALRRHSVLYLHGHQVGGCNPSLLEAMGAGNATLAHDNRFNRWVVRDGAVYFTNQESCERALDDLLQNPDQRRLLGQTNHRRAREVFDWGDILRSYSELMAQVISQITVLDDSTGWGRRPLWQMDADAS